jgi:peptide/nickel transport system ATP-binding protein
VTEPLLSVQHLGVEFDTDEGVVRAVDELSFTVAAGETLGIVGESGCGKSVTALAIMRLLPQPMGSIAGGSIRFQGEDLAKLPVARMEKIRGARIGMVFQEPMTALNPVKTVGKQLIESLLLHTDLKVEQAIRRAIEMLDHVGRGNRHGAHLQALAAYRRRADHGAGRDDPGADPRADQTHGGKRHRLRHF